MIRYSAIAVLAASALAFSAPLRAEGPGGDMKARQQEREARQEQMKKEMRAMEDRQRQDQRDLEDRHHKERKAQHEKHEQERQTLRQKLGPAK